MKVRFVILGEPKGKQRPRVVSKNGFSRAYTPKQTVMYENLVRYAYQEQVGAVKLEPPIEARIKAVFPVPKSTSKKKKALMLDGKILYTKKSDCDNIAKSILDSCNQIAYNDDSGIARLYVEKVYGENPRVEVELEEIEVDKQ